MACSTMCGGKYFKYSCYAVTTSNKAAVVALFLNIKHQGWEWFKMDDRLYTHRNTGVYEEPNFISITVLFTMICCLSEHVV